MVAGRRVIVQRNEVISLFFIKTEFQGERTAMPRRLWSEVLEGMNWLWRQPVLRFITLLTFGLTTPCVGYVLILIILAIAATLNPSVCNARTVTEV